MINDFSQLISCHVFVAFHSNYHELIHADDSQLYIYLSLSNFPRQSIALKNVSLPCTPGAVFNCLSLNPDKSDSVLFGTRQRSHSFSNVATVNVSIVPYGRSRQVTWRYTQQPPVDGQAREWSKSHSFSPSTRIATHSTSRHRHQRQYDCLFRRGLTAWLRQRRVLWRIIVEHQSSSTMQRNWIGKSYGCEVE